MKKILKLALIIIINCIFVANVFANNIYKIDMDIYLDENGDAKITEVWDVDGSDGTEWYKEIEDVDETTLTDFKVSMDGMPLTKKSWNINESLEQKKGYYGINYTSEGIELCFGKYDYNHHTFTLEYKIKDFITNVDDAQIIYWQLVNELDSVNFEDFSVTVSSYYEFPDTLDVWSFGYKGYAYVKDGKIEMSNEEGKDMDGQYAVLLAKFPLGTFASTKDFPLENNFDDVLALAKTGTLKFKIIDGIIQFISGLIGLLIDLIIPILIIVFSVKAANGTKYGYRNNKIIDKKNTPMFREIPCNKDIYYANTLINVNSSTFTYKESNIFGAIILKWVKEDKIGFQNKETGIFNKETSCLDLTRNPSFENEFEKELFDIMYKASKDGILESKELEKYCQKNYSKFFNVFKKNMNKNIEDLKARNQITIRQDKNECKYKNVLSDKIYDDSTKLYGLKLFLEEFSNIDTKEVIEVKIWDEYLMFAYLFGIADKVAKQLKNLYPEVLSETEFNYDTIVFVNNISTRSVTAASSARAAAQSYSSGGGGFSSGGGGGGSFGGGGGGSR